MARRRQMSLARCHFAHRANLIANPWFDVGPTPVAQQTLHMPTQCQPFSFKYRVGPTLARHDLWAPININSSEIFDYDFPYIYLVLLVTTIYSFSLSGMAFR